MTLARLIEPHLDKTAAEIATILNAPSQTVTDSTLWTSAGLALKFGPAVVGQIDETLKAVPGYDWVRLLLAGKGIDFSSAVTQAAMEVLRPVLPDYVDGLKSIGVSQISPWQADGNEGTVTAEQVAPVLADLITRRDAGAYWSRVLAVVNPMIDAGNTASEIKAAAAGVE